MNFFTYVNERRFSAAQLCSSIFSLNFKIEMMMTFFVKHFRWLMLVSGILTCSMILGLFSPEASLQSNFGENIEGGVANIVVRNWSALIALMGLVLIYGAFVPAVRRFALVIAGSSKVVFIALVLSLGAPYLRHGVGTAVVVDSVLVLLFVVYLLLSASKNYRHAPAQMTQ
jgi:hypothetical protein